MSKKHNSPVKVVTEVYTNKFTGARVRMARAGTIDDDAAWLVGDKCLSAYALDNYIRGEKAGKTKGFGIGGAIGFFAGIIATAAAVWSAE